MNDPIESLFLRSGALIDSEHPDISAQARVLTRNCVDLESQARNLFYFVRDRIRYHFSVPEHEEAFRASAVLAARRGFCTQKAILFCALARTCGIPAGIWFFDILDETLPKKFENLLRTKILFHHGVACLRLNDAWIRLDATLDAGLVRRRSLRPVEFETKKDAFMHPTTSDGEKHITYIKDHGIVPDVTYQDIVGWFQKAYPHLFGPSIRGF